MALDKTNALTTEANGRFHYTVAITMACTKSDWFPVVGTLCSQMKNQSTKDVRLKLVKMLLLYDWRESGLLIGPICLHKSLCLPENWYKLAYSMI